MRCLLVPALALLPALACAEDWYPSRYGVGDTLGAANNLSAAKVLAASKLVRTGKTYALGVPTGPETPALAPRKYMMTVLQPGDGTGKASGSNRFTGNDDLVTTYIGIGSQLDGLGHIGIDHLYYNGTHAREFVKTTGLTKFSTHEIPPIVTRGVLLDMARHFGIERLEAGTAFNAAQIKAAAAAQNVVIESGDVVLFHTGWLSLAETDPKRFMSGEPGLGVDGARYLAGLGVVAVGADTWGLEVLPAETKGAVFPVHSELLPKHGVYILETMDTRALIADQAWEFLFVLGQPRLVGAVQAIINPVAIR